METIIIALAPLVVTALSQGTKKLVSKKVFTNGYRRRIVQMLVAVLSYGAVVGGTMLSGGEVDLASTEVFATSFATFLAATGAYFMAKK